MYKHLLLIVLACAVTPKFVNAAEEEPGFVSIFNGRDLTGWDSKPGAWEVRDGEIWCTGSSQGKNWLIWRGGEPADFVLRLEFRWNKGNSGVQVRSDDLGEWQVFGYQVEIAKASAMGLWHHSLLEKEHPKRKARFKMTTAGEMAAIEELGTRTNTKLDVAAEVQAKYREYEWNSMEIIAEGDRLVQKINGYHFATLVDRDAEMSRAKGVIAFQDHGKGCTVAFRNIRLKETAASPVEDHGRDEEEDEGQFAAHKADAEEFFRERVTPFIKTYCIDCHQNRRPTEAGVNFSPALKHPGHAAFSHQWKKAVARVEAHDMPPEDMEQPSAEDRQMFSEWLTKVKFLSPKDPGPFVIRRLTKTEYGNTLHELFGVDPAIAGQLPEEVSGEGYLNSVSPLQMEHYLSIAQKVLDQILAPEGEPPTEMQKQLLGELPAVEADGRATAREVAQLLARKAYRRPPSEAELEVLLDVFDLGRRNNLDYPAAVRLMLKAVLVSPQFLFITPAECPEPYEEIVPLDDHQLASRLSYVLWATMPDDELMALADSGKLHEPPVLKTQVTRLLMDSRSRALFDGFGAQWLGLGDLHERPFDPDRFPQMTGDMRSAMYDEVRLFFESIVRENRSVASFIDCDYTFLNEHVATIYGLQETVIGPKMRKVELSDGNRGGILGMPGILAATSFPNRTSAVKRGVWVLEQVLGDHVPSAPPDVPALETQEGETVANLTLRERTELHRKDAVCANCHKILDPIGFGLENFDAIGRWRDKDNNGEAIDAAGELPGEGGNGKHFSSPQELKTVIAGRLDDFARNLVEKLLGYALCRRLEGYDEIVVDDLMQDVAQDEYRMQTLIRAVLTSYPFTHRRIQKEGTSNDQKRD